MAKGKRKKGKSSDASTRRSWLAKAGGGIVVLSNVSGYKLKDLVEIVGNRNNPKVPVAESIGVSHSVSVAVGHGTFVYGPILPHGPGNQHHGQV